jgi:protein-tyrosine phosphatase
MNRDFWIPGLWRGKLAITTRPRGGDWLNDEASLWRRAGIDVVVSLLEEDEAAQFELLLEGQAVEASGLQFVSFPIPDRGIPASIPHAVALLKKLGEKLDEGKNVAVHCRQGIGRSGLIAAGVLITAGMDIDEAIEVVSSARGLTVPETTKQLRWIHHLKSERLAKVL